MNASLKAAKQTIRSFIRDNWSEQKLHDVWAFNADGKMSQHVPCACILGCTGTEVLHEACSGNHYWEVKRRVGDAAEMAYMGLRWMGNGPSQEYDYYGIQRRRLSAIIRAELKRRAALRQPTHPEATEMEAQHASV